MKEYEDECSLLLEENKKKTKVPERSIIPGKIKAGYSGSPWTIRKLFKLRLKKHTKRK